MSNLVGVGGFIEKAFYDEKKKAGNDDFHEIQCRRHISLSLESLLFLKRKRVIEIGLKIRIQVYYGKRVEALNSKL